MAFSMKAEQDYSHFTRKWIAYCFDYLFSFLVLCMVALVALSSVPVMEPNPNGLDMIMPETFIFIPVTWLFKDLSYEVKTSRYWIGQTLFTLHVRIVSSSPFTAQFQQR